MLVDSNLARCLQLLYGVTLPQRNQEWGVSAVSSISWIPEDSAVPLCFV